MKFKGLQWLAAASLALTLAISIPAFSETPTDRVQFALTRSGVVWEGKISDKGESYSIELPGGGSVTASKLDVLFIGDAREDVFAYKLKETRMEDVNEVLKLADWANRRQLGGEALKVLKSRLEQSVDDAERRALQKKIDELTAAEAFRASAARVVAEREKRRREEGADPDAKEREERVESSEDERNEAWGRSLPPATLERFARKAAPALQKRCAVSGCHSPETPGARYVAREKKYGAAQRLALLYTLRDTIAYVDFERPEASPILNHPTIVNAKGERVYPFGSDRYSAKDCANFVEWLESTKGDAALAAAAKEERERRANPAARPSAASRYDVVAASSPTPVPAASADSDRNDEQNFAGLFDAPRADAAPADPNASVIRQGFAAESAKFMPNPFDDVNSTESALRRVGMIPSKSYRDEYDPAIFNDRFHESSPRDASSSADESPRSSAALEP